MKLLLTGSDGLLGCALMATIQTHPTCTGWDVVGVSLDDFDIVDPRLVEHAIASVRPQVVIHAAAHAIVDDCERDPRMAMAVNTCGTRNVVAACASLGSRVVYLSSDYVFDGISPPASGYTEEDIPSPQNIYGLTKLAGERIVALNPASLVIRTSWLFGGTNETVDPVLAMVNAARTGRSSLLIADQFSRPTYVEDLAHAIVVLIARGTSGAIHVANQGRASWFDVGRHVMASAGAAGLPAPRPISMADAGFLGRRPPDSTLSTTRLEREGVAMPTWRAAVDRFAGPLLSPTPS